MAGAGLGQGGASTIEAVDGCLKTACAKLRRQWTACFWVIVMAASVIVSSTVIFIVLSFALPCNKDLEVQLKGFTVLDMVVDHINSTPWEVTSSIDLTLAFQNPNSWVSPCKFPQREVEISVSYRDSLISIIDLEYELRPLKQSSSQTMSTTLTGNRSLVSDEAGVALEAHLLRNDNVTFVLDIKARYLLEKDLINMVNHKICEVVAKTPQQASRPGDRGFLAAECEEKVMEEAKDP